MTVYHLDLDQDRIEDATAALLPGDPERVPRIAHSFDPDAREIARRREFRTYLGRHADKPLLVTSTGIGGSSASIVIEELARLGVETYLRVGTTGAIQPDISTGDVIITTGAVRLDGASTHYAPIEYPAVAHHDVVRTLVDAARSLGRPYHVGLTATSATFYPGEERGDSYSGYVLRSLRGITDEWRELNVLNYEMEGATVLTVCSVFGLRAGCVTGVVNRAGDAITPEQLSAGEDAAIEVAVAAMSRLLELG